METVKEKCKCCFGRGVQTNKQTGMRVKCPCCNGTGNETKKIKEKPTPNWRDEQLKVKYII